MMMLRNRQTGTRARARLTSPSACAENGGGEISALAHGSNKPASGKRCRPAEVDPAPARRGKLRGCLRAKPRSRYRAALGRNRSGPRHPARRARSRRMPAVLGQPPGHWPPSPARLVCGRDTSKINRLELAGEHKAAARMANELRAEFQPHLDALAASINAMRKVRQHDKAGG
jgi:hypothetical protein